MNFDLESGPVRVLIVSEKIALPKPLDVSGLEMAELDAKQVDAKFAIGIIDSLTCRFLDWHAGLERAVEAIEPAARDSKRGQRAHERLRKALEHAEEVCGELSEAREALNFRRPVPDVSGTETA